MLKKKEGKENLPMHILLTGERQAGKSFFIRRLLRGQTRPVYGFVTKMEGEGEDGLRPVYMHPAWEKQEDWSYAKENLVGLCGREGVKEIFPRVFETLGVSLLKDAKEDGLLVMDELGYMESTAPLFTREVLEKLAGDIPVLAAVKKRPGVPFLEQVWNTPGALKYEVVPENRQALFETLAPVLMEGMRCTLTY